MFNIDPVLFPAGRFLHGNQRGDTDKPNFDGPIQGFDQCLGVFLLKRQGFMNENVNGCFTVTVAPELQYLHVLIAYPALARGAIGKLLSRDRSHRCIAKRPERSKSPCDIVRNQLNNKVGILGKAQIAMGVHRKPAGDEISDTGTVEGSNDSFEAAQFHNPALVTDV